MENPKEHEHFCKVQHSSSFNLAESSRWAQNNRTVLQSLTVKSPTQIWVLGNEEVHGRFWGSTTNMTLCGWQKNLNMFKGWTVWYNMSTETHTQVESVHRDKWAAGACLEHFQPVPHYIWKGSMGVGIQNTFKAKLKQNIFINIALCLIIYKAVRERKKQMYQWYKPVFIRAWFRPQFTPTPTITVHFNPKLLTPSPRTNLSPDLFNSHHF